MNSNFLAKAEIPLPVPLLSSPGKSTSKFIWKRGTLTSFQGTGDQEETVWTNACEPQYPHKKHAFFFYLLWGKGPSVGVWTWVEWEASVITSNHCVFRMSTQHAYLHLIRERVSSMALQPEVKHLLNETMTMQSKKPSWFTEQILREEMNQFSKDILEEKDPRKKLQSISIKFNELNEWLNPSTHPVIKAKHWPRSHRYSRKHIYVLTFEAHGPKCLNGMTLRIYLHN